ncbi:MAG: type II toxin-antitoxin system RelE/ParE family toxin [Balneolaceae bacterium]|nr:type II toxin-antitoxin system RelE/ParE family toxin [Balneolaceae bacterium]
MRIEWSSTANKDALSIIEYISEDDPVSALALIEAIEEGLEAVAELPEMGRIVPEFMIPSIRELIIKEHYRVIYEIRTEVILVSTIRHARRKPLT